MLPTPSGPCPRWPSSPCWPFSRPSHSSGTASWPSWIALTALAIPPILTNTYVGMREVDADVRDAAKAMGLTGSQVLLRVEAPLAAPFVMAGVRTAAIEVVATSTLAAYVSYSDLGTYVIAGLNTNNTVLAFCGAILVAVMAGLVAAVLGLLTRAAHAAPHATPCSLTAPQYPARLRLSPESPVAGSPSFKLTKPIG